MERKVCDRCAKELKNVACRACDAKGYYRVWLFFKRKCETCLGKGHVLRCPNEFEHIKEDMNLSRKTNEISLYRNFRKKPLPKPYSVVIKPRDKEQVPPLGDPRFPREYQKNVEYQKKVFRYNFGNDNAQKVPPPWHPAYPGNWHPRHPRNPGNQPFNPMNPNSPTNPNNPMNPMNPNSPLRK